jgi:L-ascorbate metabolism protein UlaG (beta-lactamase superfamily)
VADASDQGPEAAEALRERRKYLELEHLGRSFGALRAVLSLGMLRRFWVRLWVAPVTVAAPAPTPRPAAGAVTLSAVGHATVMLTTHETRAIVDPMLGDWLGWLRRARRAAVAPSDLAEVELILISNAHRDRLSPSSLRRLPRTATLVVPVGCASRVRDLGFARVVELAVGETLRHADLEVTATEVGGQAAGRRGHRGRQACGHLVRAEGWVIYFAGETGYFPGFLEIGRRHTPDVAVLPIGGYQPAPFRRRRLSPLDAVYAFEDLRARRLLPVAFGSFDLGYEPIDEPERWLRDLVDARGWESVVTILHNGQSCLLE